MMIAEYFIFAGFSVRYVQSAGFRGALHRVQCLGVRYRVQGLGVHYIHSSGCNKYRVQDSGHVAYREQGSGCIMYRVQGSPCHGNAMFQLKEAWSDRIQCTVCSHA